MRRTIPEVRGPRPILVLLAVILAILLLGALFAAIRVFLLPQLTGVVREAGSIDATMCRVDDCEAVLLSLFANATEVRCAFYELDLNRTADALRAIDADVLVFDENVDRVPTGLAVTPVPSSGLMHHKFCVIDGAIVTTGSMNPTRTAQSRNDENLVVIRSPTLARAYAREWEILDRRADGSSGKKPRVDAPLVEVSGTLIDVCFAPAENCERDLIAAIDGAQHSVAFMTFSFTSDAVGEALGRAADRGVMISGVFERRQLDQWSEDDALRAAGASIYLDNNPGTMHHKVFVIDNATVVTGSYNPTANANTRNDENLLIIRDIGLAREYLLEYERVRATAE